MGSASGSLSGAPGSLVIRGVEAISCASQDLQEVVAAGIEAFSEADEGILRCMGEVCLLMLDVEAVVVY
jgi:hypothetical protein